MEAIDKDETGKLNGAPRALAQAAWLTLSKSISTIFTTGSGVGPALVADHDVVLLGQQVDDLPLGLVAPLQSDDTRCRHRTRPQPRPQPTASVRPRQADPGLSKHTTLSNRRRSGQGTQ